MARITISIPSATVRKAKVVAKAQKRSLSAYVALLIESDIAEDKEMTTAMSEVRAFGANPADILRAAIPALSTRNPTA